MRCAAAHSSSSIWTVCGGVGVGFFRAATS
jgi:hypothetical protein